MQFINRLVGTSTFRTYKVGMAGDLVSITESSRCVQLNGVRTALSDFRRIVMVWVMIFALAILDESSGIHQKDVSASDIRLTGAVVFSWISVFIFCFRSLLSVGHGTSAPPIYGYTMGTLLGLMIFFLWGADLFARFALDSIIRLFAIYTGVCLVIGITADLSIERWERIREDERKQQATQ